VVATSVVASIATPVKVWSRWRARITTFSPVDGLPELR
jgi:hypothetical protein